MGAAGHDAESFRSGHGTIWKLLLILAVGFGLRLTMSVMAFASTFDTSTPGLMALHILKGERPLFYYGQNYMGGLEAYLAAFLFWIFGPSLTALSMSPILFALGWIAATFLLFRELHGDRAGLAAALTVAVPGWDTLWYSLASYGGYPAAFFFGTLALWLVIRLVNDSGPARTGWIQIPLLGLVAGLGLWTHYSCVAYLLVGLLLLVPWLIRNRARRDLWLKFAAGGVLFLIGIIPILISFQRYGGGHVAKLNPALAFILHNSIVFVDRTLPRLLFWPLEMPMWMKAAIVLVPTLAGVLWLVTICLGLKQTRPGRYFIPVIFCAIYIALYLPHSLAPTGAPRYVIPLASMAFATAFAVPLADPRRWVRKAAAFLLAIWTLYHATATVLKARERAPDNKDTIADRNRVVELARQAGADTVMMVGGPIFGHDGQTLSFYARDDIRFVSVFDERYQPSAQAAETSAHVALACETPKLSRLHAALDSAGVEYQTMTSSWASLIYDVRTPTTSRKSLPPSGLRISLNGVSGDGQVLLDRILDTSVEGAPGPDNGFTIDLGRDMALDSLWLFAPDPYQFGLPEGYQISSSTDGQTFATLRTVESQISACYTFGDQVYLKGYQAKMELRFGGEPARFVRLICTKPQTKQEKWNLAEVFVFERTDTSSGSAGEDVTALVETIQREQIDFTIADRWLSARLLKQLPWPDGQPPAYPRFNPKVRSTHLSRTIIPRLGLAIAPLREVADECASELEKVYGPDVIRGRRDFQQYSLIWLNAHEPVTDPAVRIVWNGHVLLQSIQPEGKWY